MANITGESRRLSRPRMYIDHVSLTVRDVDRSIQFYKALGLKVLRISILGQPPNQFRNAFLYNGQFMLELLPSIGGRPRKQSERMLARDALRGSLGITHLGVRVTNLDAAIERLRTVGATMIKEPHTIDRGAVNVAYFDELANRAIHYMRKPARKPWRIAMFSDPDGAVIELVER